MDTFSASCPCPNLGIASRADWPPWLLGLNPQQPEARTASIFIPLIKAIPLGGASWTGELAWGCIHSSGFVPVPLKTGEGTVLVFYHSVIVPRRTLQPTGPFMFREYIKAHGVDFESDSKSNPS